MSQSSEALTSFLELRFPPNYYRVTNANEAISTPQGTFNPDPAMEVVLLDRDGGLEEKPFRIRISVTDVVFMSDVFAGDALPHMRVRYWEQRGANLRKMFDGEAHTVEQNPSGYPKMIEIVAESEKAKADASLGIQILDDCAWHFGDAKTCGVDIVPLQEVGTILDVGNFTLTASGISTQATNYWREGSILVDGLSIKIRAATVDGSTFRLLRTAPQSWIGKQGVFTPGCDQREETCRRWQQIARFSGAGKKIPDYNPVFENPSY